MHGEVSASAYVLDEEPSCVHKVKVGTVTLTYESTHFDFPVPEVFVAGLCSCLSSVIYPLFLVRPPFVLIIPMNSLP